MTVLGIRRWIESSSIDRRAAARHPPYG